MAKKPERTLTPAPSPIPGELPERWSVQRKQEVVLRLLRGESLDEFHDMLEARGSYIKLAVDVAREVIVGGGAYHADCEEISSGRGAARRTFGARTGIQRAAR